MAERAPVDRGADQAAGLRAVAGALAVMWVLEIADQALGGVELDGLGIEPREADGLVGIVTAPFLHVGFGHLLANTVPFVVLGALVALGGLTRVLAVAAIVAAVGGAGVWLLAPSDTEHLGASGVVFGLATYLMARAWWSRTAAHLLGAVVVLVLYGSTLVLGVLPEEGVSWQGHLFGAVGGVVAARVLHDRRIAAAGGRA